MTEEEEEEHDPKLEAIQDILTRYSTPEAWPEFQEHLETREQQSDEWVYPQGNLDAEILILMGAPEREDAETGGLFGRDVHHTIISTLLSACQLTMEEVYFLPILPFRLYKPDGKPRTPLMSEGKTLLRYVGEQMELVDPKVVLILGSDPYRFVRTTKRSFSKAASDHRILHHIIETPGRMLSVQRPAFVSYDLFNLETKSDDRKGGILDTALRTWLKATAFTHYTNDIYAIAQEDM